MTPSFEVVIPTLGRPSLARGLVALAANQPRPEAVHVCLDARAARVALPASAPRALRERISVLRAARPGPASARNAGWRAARSPWVAFVDDDVVVPPGWTTALANDLARAAPDVAGSQGRVTVPRVGARPLTDWERNVGALETARYATADMAYRRAVLAEVGGFDERFVRAYREDSDLALRVLAAGHRIVTGKRWVTHPVGPASFWESVGRQAQNADDVLMRVLHGPAWRAVAGAPQGRKRRHAAVTAVGIAGALGLLAGRPRAGACCLGAWALGVGELAWARIAPGPRDRGEVTKIVATSALIPAAASWHLLWAWPRALRLDRAASSGGSPARRKAPVPVREDGAVQAPRA